MTYPRGTVHALLESAFVTTPTRRAIAQRSARDHTGEPLFFTSHEMALLRAVCARLIAADELTAHLDIAGEIDDRLHRGAGDGWRYADLPRDTDAYRLGLRGVSEQAMHVFSRAFITLDTQEQDSVLTDVQRGRARVSAFDTMSGAQFFEELLTEVVELAYSHVAVQEDIGYVGMADATGWTQLGLDVLDPREPRPRSSS